MQQGAFFGSAVAVERASIFITHSIVFTSSSVGYIVAYRVLRAHRVSFVWRGGIAAQQHLGILRQRYALLDHASRQALELLVPQNQVSHVVAHTQRHASRLVQLARPV